MNNPENKSEDGGQRAEGGSQKSEVGGQGGRFLCGLLRKPAKMGNHAFAGNLPPRQRMVLRAGRSGRYSHRRRENHIGQPNLSGKRRESANHVFLVSSLGFHINSAANKLTNIFDCCKG